MALKLLRPSYALTGLLLFGGYQGYSLVKSATEPLRPMVASEQGQAKKVAASTDTAVAVNSAEEPGTIAAAVQRIHPGMRIVSWLIIYGLGCLATVPVISRVLRRESNLANGLMLVVYLAIGFLLAFCLAAFRVNWITVILFVAALVVSAVLVVRLASALERMRIQR